VNDHDSFDDVLDDASVDELLHALGRLMYEEHPALLEEDPRFMNWLATDLRRRPPEKGDWDVGRVTRVRRRIIERALAERCGVDDGGRAPALREVSAATVAQSIDDASHARCAPWTPLAAAAGEGRELWDEECDRWVELPPRIETGRYVALQVAGDSMTPLFHAGDTILVRLGSEVRRDSVIVARRPDSGYVVKRVGQVVGPRIELLSLNPAYGPVFVQRAAGAVLGTVVMRWCAHGSSERLTR
jgi:SOS-response transcriptional repressor LexA